jgi:hypothetical protein
MRPLFTIHAGEYLVGLHVQKSLKLNAWIPAKDFGIDLLVTDSDNRHAVSLQVKYGKDFLPEERNPELREKLRCISWFTLNRAKLKDSPAEFWVFVLHGFKSKVPDFVVIPTTELQQRMAKLHNEKTLQIYLCTTGSKRCWEIRGLGHDVPKIEEGVRKEPLRDFTQYLNASGWAAVANRLKG